MSQGARDRWHWGWDVEWLVTDPGGTSGVPESPDSRCSSVSTGPTINAHALPTTSWEVGNEWAALYFTAHVPTQ